MTETPEFRPHPDGQPTISQLGVTLKSRRREKRLSLRDLAAEIGVSINTLSRVERGHVPDLANFRRIVDWLEMPAEAFLEAPIDASSTPEAIARHLRADPRLPPNSAMQIAELVEVMYHKLVGENPSIAVHMRSAKTFTPRAGELLTEILRDFQAELLSDLGRE